MLFGILFGGLWFPFSNVGFSRGVEITVDHFFYPEATNSSLFNLKDEIEMEMEGYKYLRWLILIQLALAGHRYFRGRILQHK